MRRPFRLGQQQKEPHAHEDGTCRCLDGFSFEILITADMTPAGLIVVTP